MSVSSSRRRIELDVKKLLSSNPNAVLVNDNIRELCVCLEGPKDTLYEGGVWKVHVELPDQYPYKSPSIGFETKIFHPNIDEHSGSVCLDVINQTWSPMFTMCHIFDTFIPQLLNYPNASDPLNGDASSLYFNDRKSYNIKVKEYVTKYANREEVLRQFKTENDIVDIDDVSDIENDEDENLDGESDIDISHINNMNDSDDNADFDDSDMGSVVMDMDL